MMAPIFTSTMMLLAPADSRMPRTRSTVKMKTMRNAGNIEVSARPMSARPDRRRPVIWYMQSKRGQLCFQVSAKPNCHSHVADRIFQNQVPANDPRDQFAQSRVRIRIRAARNRDHRRQFGIAQSGKTAGDRHQKK